MIEEGAGGRGPGAGSGMEFKLQLALGTPVTKSKLKLELHTLTPGPLTPALAPVFGTFLAPPGNTIRRNTAGILDRKRTYA